MKKHSCKILYHDKIAYLMLKVSRDAMKLTRDAMKLSNIGGYYKWNAFFSSGFRTLPFTGR